MWVKLDEIGWKWMKVNESEWKWMKVNESGWNWMKLDESGWKWIKMDESGWKWKKVDESGWKYPRCYMHLWCRYILHVDSNINIAFKTIKIFYSQSKSKVLFSSYSFLLHPCTHMCFHYDIMISSLSYLSTSHMILTDAGRLKAAEESKYHAKTHHWTFCLCSGFDPINV